MTLLYTILVLLALAACFLVGYHYGWKAGCHAGMEIANGIWEATTGKGPKPLK